MAKPSMIPSQRNSATPIE